ncbi:MAG: MBG domain-containing protein, partial [Clostridiales bacterium]|nr:MBG domain-containing protein [Clostridiales bacterium]
KDITGVSFENKTVIYNGEEQTITVTGTLPQGVSASYTNNKGTNANTYNATVLLSGTGYNPLTLTATLTINKAEITGITFTGDTLDYDGNEHEITITGTLPQGASVSYTSNKGTNAGTYNATATLSGANYVTKTLNAVLTINKLTFTGITFSGDTYAYDGLPHRIEIVGQLPQGSQVQYSCAENPAVQNSATATGTYNITATVTNPNYETAQYNATLKITASDKERYITYANGALYFGNALDKDRLYSYTTTDGLKNISSDVPYSFTSIGSTLYFRSYSVYASSIKSISATGTDAIAPEKGEYLCSDSTNLYYVVNGLTAEKSGIYKLNPSASEPTPVLLSQGKAKYLQCYG